MSDTHETDSSEEGGGDEFDGDAVSATAADLVRTIDFATRLNPLLNAGRVYEDIGKQIRSVADAVQLPKFDLPDLTWINRGIADTLAEATKQTETWERINTSVRALQAVIAPQWDGFFASLDLWRKKLWPENWANVNNLSIELVETICLDEGIPLMWVPRPDTVQALVDAPDGAARRRIIGQRYRGIIADCSAILDGLEHQSLHQARQFAYDAIRALREGHTAAAQALAANLIDTLLTQHLHPTDRKKIKENKFHQSGERLDLDDYQFHAGLTFAPVWCAYMHYFPDRGDTVPHRFARHASAHTVSTRQYSKVNAVFALMVVASVLKFVDEYASG
ncbi:hypothetical protein [Glycomyces sp. YM15]|uniref:hypothetical protein n=1 Tax=Glycomyces sp. YM15 TaxID=2800446 RepID=UPI0019668890|nr:hypothetical protein [Glycomyces sp. YM15]